MDVLDIRFIIKIRPEVLLHFQHQGAPLFAIGGRFILLHFIEGVRNNGDQKVQHDDQLEQAGDHENQEVDGLVDFAFEGIEVAHDSQLVVLFQLLVELRSVMAL